MKLKSFHWTRRTAVYALIALAVVLALLVIWRSNDGVLSAHYNVTTTEGRITYPVSYTHLTLPTTSRV